MVFATNSRFFKPWRFQQIFMAANDNTGGSNDRLVVRSKIKNVCRSMRFKDFQGPFDDC